MSTCASCARTPGESTVSPDGSVTTGTIGALSPPVPPKRPAIAMLVSQPSLPGTENFWSRAFVAEFADAIPTSVSTSQKTATVRLCARTQRVTEDMTATSGVIYGLEIVSD